MEVVESPSEEVKPEGQKDSNRYILYFPSSRIPVCRACLQDTAMKEVESPKRNKDCFSKSCLYNRFSSSMVWFLYTVLACRRWFHLKR